MYVTMSKIHGVWYTKDSIDAIFQAGAVRVPVREHITRLALDNINMHPTEIAEALNCSVSYAYSVANTARQLVTA